MQTRKWGQGCRFHFTAVTADWVRTPVCCVLHSVLGLCLTFGTKTPLSAGFTAVGVIVDASSRH